MKEMTTVKMSETKIHVKYAIHCGMIPVSRKNDTNTTDTVIAMTTATVLVLFHHSPNTIGKNGAPTKPPTVSIAVSSETFCNKIVAIRMINATTIEETLTNRKDWAFVAIALMYF